MIASTNSFLSHLFSNFDKTAKVGLSNLEECTVVQSLNCPFFPPRAGEIRVQDNLHAHAQNAAIFSPQIRGKTIFGIIINFPYNTHFDWLKQRALSENKARVDDGRLAFEFVIRNFDKFDPN